MNRKHFLFYKYWEQQDANEHKTETWGEYWRRKDLAKQKWLNNGIDPAPLSQTFDQDQQGASVHNAGEYWYRKELAKQKWVAKIKTRVVLTIIIKKTEIYMHFNVFIH